MQHSCLNLLEYEIGSKFKIFVVGSIAIRIPISKHSWLDLLQYEFQFHSICVWIYSSTNGVPISWFTIIVNEVFSLFVIAFSKLCFLPFAGIQLEHYRL